MTPPQRMSLTHPLTQTPQPAFELKGRMMTLSVLRVLTPDTHMIGEQLDMKIASAPDLFRNFPVLLDFEGLDTEAQTTFDIARLDRLLRDRSFMPVGIRGACTVLAGIAAGVGIGTLSIGSTTKPRGDYSSPDKENATNAANLLIKNPVRSGQQIYAKGGDLTILAAVSPGAEVLADGNIHVYGALRGRALAGVSGNTEARIFCRELEAELVSVAGHYRISEHISEADRRRPVQIFLDGEDLVIDGL